MTTEKLVTHEDREAAEMLLRILRAHEATDPGATDLAQRIKAAAEADAPPLPEGWVVLTTPSTGSARILFHHPDGSLTAWDDHGSPWGYVSDARECGQHLSPLRPTVSEADVEKAAIAYMSNDTDDDWEIDDSDDVKRHGRKVARTVLRAAGVEVAR